MNTPTRFLIVLVLAAAVAGACLPEATGPSRPPATGSTSIATASPGPTGPTPIPSFVPPTPTPLPSFVVHNVVRGDSLTSIARRFGTTGRSIAFWNRATYPSLDPDSPTYSPNRIEVGWKLSLIPGVKLNDDDLPEPSASP
jgi:nucleoid-associated protein YgaU